MHVKILLKFHKMVVRFYFFLFSFGFCFDLFFGVNLKISELAFSHQNIFGPLLGCTHPRYSQIELIPILSKLFVD